MSAFMSRRKTVSCIVALVMSAALLALTATFFTCTKENPASPTVVEAWTLSGNVQDGYLGKPMLKAVVEWTDRNGRLVQAKTDTAGHFVCPDLPYGQTQFRVTADSSTRYTTNVMKISSGDKNSAIKNADSTKMTFRDTTVIVKLFPLTGAVSGKVQTRIHALAARNAAVGAVVSVTYNNTDMTNASPRSFQAVTNDSGAFSIRGLPVATGAAIAIAPINISGLDWSVDGQISQPTLVSGSTVPMATIFMAPLNAAAFSLVFTNFQNNVIRPNDTLVLTYSEAVDSAASYATLATGATTANIPLTVSAKGSQITLIPKTQLVDATTYNLNVYAYGKNGGNVATTRTITARAGGVALVVASNVLNADKTGISGFGLTDSVFFSFSQHVNTNAIISMYSQATGLYDVVTTSLLDSSTIMVKPQPRWKVGQYTVSVSASLADGTPVYFQVNVVTVGGLDFVTSNVYDPIGQTMKNGLVPTDTIVFTTNKPISSAVGIMREGNATTGAAVPLNVSASGSTIKVKSVDPLKFATTYYLYLTATTAQGESKTAGPSGYVYFVTTSSSFYVVSSNARVSNDPANPVANFVPTDSIKIIMSKNVKSATAQITSGTTSPKLLTNIKSDTLIIYPENVAFATGGTYTIALSATSADGIQYTASPFVTNLVMRQDFYVVSSNVRLNNDASQGVINFPITGDFIVVMSKRVASATMTMSGGIPIIVSISGDTITGNPQSYLQPGSTYSISLTAQSTGGLNIVANPLVNALQAAPANSYILASNIMTIDGTPVTNAPINITPWFLLSVTPVASQTKASITSFTPTVSVNGDTLFVVPPVNLAYATTYTVSATGKASNGTYINISRSFTTASQPQVYVASSNVHNPAMIGLQNIPIDVTVKVRLTSAPKAGTVTAAFSPAMPNVVTVSGDTVIIHPNSNLSYGTTYTLSLTGTDVNGIVFSGLSVGSSGFTTEPAVYVVATNMVDANGKPILTFDRYSTMWVKFSALLSTDKSTYTWDAYNSANATYLASADRITNATTQVIGDGTSTQPNAVARMSNDTLFVTPDNRLAMGYGAYYGFNITITTRAGRTATYGFAIKTAPLNLYVQATNTKDANGAMRTDFGYRDTVWVVSNLKIDSITAVNVTNTAVPDNGAGVLRSRVRLSANGDTIFYAPSAKLSASTTYGLTFDVVLHGEAIGMAGVPHAGQLGITWKTKAGVQITAMNVMANATTFRPFKVIGDSIVVTFSKAIDTSFNAPTPFLVSNAGGAGQWNGGKYSATWSANLTTVTVKNSVTDTLNGRPYSTAANEYSTNNTVYDYPLSFHVTCADGEENADLEGSNAFVGKLALKTEMKMALVNSNVLQGLDGVSAVDPSVASSHKDTFALSEPITLTFSRAVDSTKIKSDASHQYQSFLMVVDDNDVYTPLQFNVAFSNSGKTITLTMVNPLIAGDQYEVWLGNIPVLGMKAADNFTSSGTNNTILDAYDFKVLPTPAVNISALTCQIAVDTVPGTWNVAGNRKGYTPSSASYSGTQAAGNLGVIVKEVAWNARHSDSVNFYQYRVQSNGGQWFIADRSTCASNYATGTYNTFDPENLTTKSWKQFTFDLTGESFYTGGEIKTADADGAGSNYQNGADLFNDSVIVGAQVRAVKQNGSDYSYSQWSNTISFVDNVAPGDSDYGQTNVGLDITHYNDQTWNRTSGGGSNTPDSSNYILFTFPEDMDISTTPAINFYDGSGVPSVSRPSAASTSHWLDARTYQMYLKVPGANDYSGGVWYFKTSVNGMKDASGITLQRTGDLGSPVGADNTAYTNVGSVPPYPVQGNILVGAGYIQIP